MSLSLSNFNPVDITSSTYNSGQPISGSISQTNSVRKITIPVKGLGTNYSSDCVYSGLFVMFDDAENRTIKECTDGGQPIGFIEYTAPFNVAKDSDGVIYNVWKKEQFSPQSVVSVMTDLKSNFKAAEDLVEGDAVMVYGGNQLKKATSGNVAFGIVTKGGSAGSVVEITFRN